MFRETLGYIEMLCCAIQYPIRSVFVYKNIYTRVPPALYILLPSRPWNVNSPSLIFIYSIVLCCYTLDGFSACVLPFDSLAHNFHSLPPPSADSILFFPFFKNNNNNNNDTHTHKKIDKAITRVYRCTWYIISVYSSARRRDEREIYI